MKNINEIICKHLPEEGANKTFATQVVIAVHKIVDGWYSNGDVYDNTAMMIGMDNDLSNYANWLAKYVGVTVLHKIFDPQLCRTEEDYEGILVELVSETLDCGRLIEWNKQPTQGSIYDCKGDFRFINPV